MMPGVLVAFHKGASIPAPLQGEEGGGSEYIPLSSCPGGVSTLAVEQGMKTGLSPCRHAGLGMPGSKRDIDPFPPPARKTEQTAAVVRRSHHTWTHRASVDCGQKCVSVVKLRKEKRKVFIENMSHCEPS